MRPAPFDDKYIHANPSTGKRVESTELKTQVLDEKGTLLYEIPDLFSGRRTMALSPDGQTLILDGNFYFGTLFLRTPDITKDEIVTLVYHQGQLWKEICFATDLNDGTAIEERGAALGGGWLQRKRYISKNSIDWDRGILSYTMINEDLTTVSKTIKLP